VPAGCALPSVDQECRALYDPTAVVGLPSHLVEAARTRASTLQGAARVQTLAELAGRRLDVLAEALEMDRCRLADWGLVRGALAEAWRVQATQPACSPLPMALLAFWQR